MFALTELSIEEISTTLSDPEGWASAQAVFGCQYVEEPYITPQKEMNQWRVQFLSAIQSK
ncbi:hypothetical protein VIBNISOn1_20004 [Vibrio nigripulchritudo SOn1]|uniref:Uncharacterized protein n=1 Tax=Vibrio nigripulchritudo SOn1 TaxID=1238450 RepID=A0AAV2VQQ4_9VIBR|nr:hypothetical protein [Vibrio nigripulchritudo]CCO46996.1 hypothetical protein VIBNISOn1_20004 [Vibrio nigripulchritudo SOn1]